MCRNCRRCQRWYNWTAVTATGSGRNPATDLTPKVVAARLGYSERTVRGWCAAGYIGYRPVPGGNWRITPEDAERARTGDLGGSGVE